MNSTAFNSLDVPAEATRIADAAGHFSEGASEQVDKMAHSAAATVRDAVDDVRGKAADVGGQLQSYLKANPAHALIGGVVLGFVIGRFMSRS
jgi:ElaB/YqjD/DUF883 family membrane-anchored ribosome-binding protein